MFLLTGPYFHCCYSKFFPCRKMPPFGIASKYHHLHQVTFRKSQATHFLLNPSGVPFSPAHLTPLPLISSVKEEGQKIPSITVYSNMTCEPQELNSKRRTFARLPELKDDTCALIWLTRMPLASQHGRTSSKL